jgi:diguanylate cyclase (GGDEF)-like protein
VSENFAGLPGYRRFLAALDSALRRCGPRKRVGVVLVRARHVQEIKASHGYECAEALVRTLAGRIVRVLRDNDEIERIEDSCIALILPDLSATAQAELAANGILAACQQPYEAGGDRLSPKVSVGVAIYPTDASTSGDLVRCADIAAAEATDTPAGYAIFNQAMDQTRQSQRSYQLERELEGAIGRGELHVCFQPKVALRDGALVGAEALLRWTRADGKAVPPDVFIPIAEQSNLIVPLTVWTLNTAMRACSDLLESDPGFSIAVNLSPVALNDPDIFALIAQAASIWCSTRQQLVLEITETALFRDPVTALRTLEEFHGEGIRLSIDDFGTGYSSLAQLARVRLNELKIDRSFVNGVTRIERNMQIVRSVIDLAHNFGLTVVAEGIEDDETYACLAALGCDHGQGYYIARPMVTDIFLEWAQTGRVTRPALDLA